MFHPNSEEPMDVATYQAQMAPLQNEEEVLLTLSLKWSWIDPPQGQKIFLERCLQTWFNKRKAKVSCSVERTVGDGSFVIKIKPLPALSDLQKLTGETLTTRGGKAKVTILSVSLGSSMMDAQTPDHVSANPVSVNDDKACPRKRSRRFSAAEANSSLDGVSEQSCLISVDHFGYINHIYSGEIKQIEKKNKSHILVHVNVTFESDQTDGRPNEALSDFTKLLQKHSADSSGSVFPLKFVDPDQWSEALKIIQKKNNKLFLTLSSEEMIVYGPRQSKEAFSETLNATQKTNTPSYTPKETKAASQNTSLWTDTSNWNTVLITEPFTKEIFNKTSAKIKTKSDLNLRESNFKKSDIKSSSKNSGGTLSSLTSAQLYGATGLCGSLTSDDQSNNISRRPSLSKQTKQHFDAPTGGGAKAGSSKGETCPICLDPIINKKQLNCKHQFCEECLQKAIKYNGPICPICKDVFGVMEGDQPDGTMTWVKHPSSLPGFPDCGYILITYNIPSGKQTEKHPKPGERYQGITRTAYLPDNNEGNEVLKLLKKAFDQKLIFTVGTSRTTGMENQVIWNDISHKTSIYGGSESFGYPDPMYLSRVKEELKDMGIK